MLPSLHRLAATGVKQFRIEEERARQQRRALNNQPLIIQGNKRAVDLLEALDVKYQHGLQEYDAKCARLRTVGIAPDSTSPSDRDADERRLQASLEEAELTPEAFNDWFTFLRALSMREDRRKQDVALDALMHLERNVDVWLNVEWFDRVRECRLWHPRYRKIAHGPDDEWYDEHMQFSLFERLQIYIAGGHWEKALTLLTMAHEVRGLVMDRDLRESPPEQYKLPEGYRTYEDLLAQVNMLVFEEAQRRFEDAQASSSTT